MRRTHRCHPRPNIERPAPLPSSRRDLCARAASRVPRVRLGFWTECTRAPGTPTVGVFPKHAVADLFQHLIVLDLLDSYEAYPRGWISVERVDVLRFAPGQRHTTSIITHIITGTMLSSGSEVASLHQSPLLWPPFLDHPFSSDSLVFWAKHGHRFLRRPLAIFGGYPGHWLGAWTPTGAAKVMLFKVFTTSRLYDVCDEERVWWGYHVVFRVAGCCGWVNVYGLAW